MSSQSVDSESIQLVNKILTVNYYWGNQLTGLNLNLDLCFDTRYIGICFTLSFCLSFDLNLALFLLLVVFNLSIDLNTGLSSCVYVAIGVSVGNQEDICLSICIVCICYCCIVYFYYMPIKFPLFKKLIISYY